ncbi:transcription elongation factor SPT4-like [Oscarella lobularis]|uniref:transcription elongation factor SPT4-like n=1 Tax=Oscarella lobularis TaxID=121494 RepID=UPI0033136B0A
METVPKDLRQLRACLLCSLIKTLEQFEMDGCDNCEELLQLRNSREAIYDCTSSNFDGMIGLMSPEESWVARWQRIGSFKRGCYAVSVSGELPRHIAQELRSRGVRYQSRDRTAKMN